ncbi:hypothetical protein PspLS_07077 [Pyricularia sp. CBS 133598]|nr:hypothetical protein PspLS_07077 [Pyricularia sp. CBS 133598]
MQLDRVLPIALAALQASRAAAEVTGWCYVDLLFKGLEQEGHLRKAGQGYTAEIKEEVEGCLPDGWDIVGTVASPNFPEEQCYETNDEEQEPQDGGDIVGTAGNFNFLNELCEWEKRRGTAATKLDG